MQQEHPILEIHGQPSPIIATAIHDGHYLSPGLEVLSGLTDEERLREEDPFTTDMISKFPTRVIAKRSRFEFDLNRAPESCIYLKPEDAWGLPVWKEMPNDEQLMECISGYDLAYSELKSLVKLSIEEFGQVVVLDVHSYNHHRAGADQPFDDPFHNPDVNIGTGNINMQVWGELIEDMQAQMLKWKIDGNYLDVRRNVKFKGGYFTKWLHEEFGDRVCGIAVEFKKIFMDEWKGEKFPVALSGISEQLPGLQPVIDRHLHQPVK